MSKKKEVTLNSHQLHELKFFCKNCTGLNKEFYDLMDKFMEYKTKIDRLIRASKEISKYLESIGEDSDISPFKGFLDSTKEIETVLPSGKQ